VWKVYGTITSKWKTLFDQLVDYQTNNPGPNSTFCSRKTHPRLGEWVATQRKLYANNELPEEHIELLESIGFVWEDSKSNRWMELFQQLVQYKKDHPGDKSTMVPSPYPPNPRLSEWVRTQRVLQSRGELPKTRRQLLESVGFCWKAASSRWRAVYDRLVEYSRQHGGSTAVPFAYEPDPSLGRWVAYNRFHCKDPERIKLLNAIGFAWTVPTKKSLRKPNQQRNVPE